MQLSFGIFLVTIRTDFPAIYLLTGIQITTTWKILVRKPISSLFGNLVRALYRKETGAGSTKGNLPK